MTCKDCVHCEACKISSAYFGEEKGSKAFSEYEKRQTVELDCEHFKDKTRFVELPCKVGDTIYKVWYLPCHNGETYPSYSCCGCEDECDLKKTIFEFKVPSIQFIVNELLEKDNRVYYLTREEAEKALERSRE